MSTDLLKLAKEQDEKISTLPEWVKQLFRERVLTARLIEAQQGPQPVCDDRLPAFLRPQV